MYVLGIDIGTTSVKVCIYDGEAKSVVAKQSKDTAANIPSDQGIEGNKQDVPKIVSAIHGCISRLPRDLLKNVYKIGVCGQMHGVMMWSVGEPSAWSKVRKDEMLIRFEANREKMSALYTWQDTRCKQDFLNSLPKPDSHLSCYSGYGCATLLWMAKHKPEKLKNFTCAGTVQDFVVAMLCNLKKPIMSDQNAASWGYFNTETRKWNVEILKSVNFPVDFLPEITKSGNFAGVLDDVWEGIPAGTSVGAGLCDLQCSFLGTLQSPNDAALNISTSAHLGFVCNSVDMNEIATIEYLPFFNDKYLAVSTSINGGNVLATFVKTVQQWVVDLGFSVPQSKVWEKVISRGLLAAHNESPLEINPCLLGERHTPNIRASVNNINLSNLSLGQVFKSLCEGVVQNIHSMMPRDFLTKAGINRIVGNGSGLSRNQVLQSAVRQMYNLPLEFTAGGDAARGAAIAVLDTPIKVIFF